jgi:hypothetical protein
MNLPKNGIAQFLRGPTAVQPTNLDEMVAQLALAKGTRTGKL